MKVKSLFSTAAAALALAVASISSADYTCETVARNGDLDPDGDVLTAAFGSVVAVNAAGDALITGRAMREKTRLYLYEGAGASETVAQGNTLAPNGGTFRPSSPFHDISINDAGDLAFLGRLRPGQGIFIRESGGGFDTAAETTGASPNGGTYDSFTAVSQINQSGQIAFAATVVGAPSGVFLYDSATDSSTTEIEVGDLTLGANEICSIEAVGLGDSGAIAVRAIVAATDCLVDPVEGVLLYDGIFLEEIALVGDATPIGGTTYSDFEQSPLVNASDNVAFRAEAVGVANETAIFLHDPSGPTTSAIVVRGEATPAGGGVGKLQSFRLSDADQIFFRSTISQSPERIGVFGFDGLDETVLTKTSTPPTDAFGVGAIFSNLNSPGISADGNTVAIQVAVRDTVAPRGRRAVIRCNP